MSGTTAAPSATAPSVEPPVASPNGATDTTTTADSAAPPSSSSSCPPSTTSPVEGAEERRRKLGSVVKVEEVLDHPDADRLSIAAVKGWHVVTNKERDGYKAGDLAVYMEIDTIVPEALLIGRAEHEILKKKKFIIKTAKIRGAISQGILFRTDVLDGLPGAPFSEGDDVTDVLGLTKHDTEALFAKTSGGKAKGPFPTDVPKTDEERVQNLSNVLRDLIGEVLYATEKLDGSSFTASMRGGELTVASRNQAVPEDTVWGEAAVALRLAERLRDAGLDDIALQGELVGPKVQDNRYALKARTVKFFNVFNIAERRHLPFAEAKALVQSLGLDFVPIVQEAFTVEEDTSPQALLLLAEGKSSLNPKTLREGLVFRSVRSARHPTLGRVSFKAISNQFLLKAK